MTWALRMIKTGPARAARLGKQRAATPINVNQSQNLNKGFLENPAKHANMERKSPNVGHFEQDVFQEARNG